MCISIKHGKYVNHDEKMYPVDFGCDVQGPNVLIWN